MGFDSPSPPKRLHQRIGDSNFTVAHEDAKTRSLNRQGVPIDTGIAASLLKSSKLIFRISAGFIEIVKAVFPDSRELTTNSIGGVGRDLLHRDCEFTIFLLQNLGNAERHLDRCLGFCTSRLVSPGR